MVGNFGIQNQFTGAHLGEQAFARMGELFQFGEAEEAATALDGVDGSENAAEEFGIAGVGFKVDEFLIEAIEVLRAFLQEVFNQFVHGAGPSLWAHGRSCNLETMRVERGMRSL